MKAPFFITILALVLISCKSNNSTDEQLYEAISTLTTAQKIANAHGFDQWKNVDQLDFTFNVDRDSIHFERSWIWKPLKNEITLISGSDTLSYNRNSVDSLSLNADRAFVNDKYWLMVPFQLVWDVNVSLSDSTNIASPISKTVMNKLTITYPSDGGYTPGDAYDIFYDENYLIKEWIFRKGNSTEPSLTTTFENYQDYNGIKIATEHKRSDTSWNLNFTNISVKLN